jgi:hypothetical protein
VSVALILCGALLIALVCLDALVTTLDVGSQQGWLTRWPTRLLWRLVTWSQRSRAVPSLVVVAGPVMVVMTVLLWVSLLWAGTSLVLLGGDPAVVDATTRAPAGIAEVVYYAGFTIFTLGVGDYAGAGDGWRLFTAAMSFAGLVLVTLSITYLLSVVGAVVHRRSVAVHIHSLGSTPGRIVAGGWDGSAFTSAFQQHLVTLTTEMSTLAEQHLAYPVLRYFHSGVRATAAPVAVAVLDDALLLLDCAVDEGARPAASATEPLRQAIERHLGTSARAFHDGRAAVPPPPPDRDELAAAGIPLATDTRFAAAVEARSERRARLQSFVSGSGWTWGTE